MRTYEQIMADAKPQRPFSNGTEGYAWMDNWCWHPCRKDRNEDCPLIVIVHKQATDRLGITLAEPRAATLNRAVADARSWLKRNGQVSL